MKGNRGEGQIRGESEREEDESKDRRAFHTIDIRKESLLYTHTHKKSYHELLKYKYGENSSEPKPSFGSFLFSFFSRHGERSKFHMNATMYAIIANNNISLKKSASTHSFRFFSLKL